MGVVPADAALEVAVVDLPPHRRERLRPLLLAAADPPSLVGVIGALRFCVDEIGEVADVALSAGTHRHVVGSVVRLGDGRVEARGVISQMASPPLTGAAREAGCTGRPGRRGRACD